MNAYAVFLHAGLLEAMPTRGRQREIILKFVRELAGNLFQRGDYTERDETARTMEVKIVAGHALTWWPDHAVKEIKVVRVQRADG